MQCQTRLLPPLNYLIVEDDLIDLQMMTRAVIHAHKEIRVQVANTLKRARLVLTQLPVLVILMENTLPDGRGVDFAMELSTNSRFATIPVIIATDWPSPFMWHKAKRAGVRHVVDKSEFGPALIRDALNSHLTYGR